MTNKNKINFAFFGSSRFSVLVLEQLTKSGYTPNLIITTHDKPRGRKLLVKSNIVKDWAQKNNIAVLDPIKFSPELKDALSQKHFDLFVVASYGKIIPKEIIELPVKGTLNIHPSLLPKYRGASPLQSAILDDQKNTGVTIMLIDEAMDHGPIIGQKEILISEWPTYEEFENLMAKEGTKLLVLVLEKWVSGEIKAIEQAHNQASYTKKISKSDGLIDLSDDPYLNFRKIQAFHEWPQAYFLIEKSGKTLRIKVTKASFVDGLLKIEKVIPEGSKEMDYEDFRRGYGV